VGEDSATPLKGKRVVVTRAAEQSEQLVQALREKGAVPVVMPMVAFGLPDDPALLDGAIRGMRSYDWIILTSQNAVRALQERSQFLKLRLADAMAGVPVAAVGPATAEAAAKAGLKVVYVATKHQGVSLAEELAEKIRGKRVLLPRSDRANPELVEKLERLGAQVKEIVAYKTIRPDQQDLSKAEELLREGADAVLFFSPSAVHHLQQLLGSEKFREFSRQSVFGAIGPVTEEALRKAKVERVLLAQDTTVAAVIVALTDYFSQPGPRLPAGVKPG
jgi:uroporphyrinogen III methyltransferase/synthase